MKYQSDLIKEIVEKRGHHLSSPHYESECVESWIEETKGAYPKLCDYESEWLNYINETPLGVFPYETLVDITKATVDNVVPYAYKSAILKGQTLVNVLDIKASSTYLASKELTGFSFNAIQHFDEQMISTKGNYKKGSDYTLLFNSDHAFTLQIGYDMTNTEWKRYDIKIGRNIIKVATLSDTSYDYIMLRTDSNTINHEKVTLSNFIILEGDYSSYSMDIPYFEGMQSVKMPVLTTTGKNLFDSELEVGGLNSTNGKNDDTQKDRIRTKSYIKVKPNTFYMLSRTIYKGVWTVRYYDENYNHISPNSYNTHDTMEIKTDVNVHYIRMVDLTNDLNNLYQVEEGKQVSSYEPHKSNILTVNEPVELRGIGDVKDELDCLTGELTQRIGEIVLDGTQNMVSAGHGVYIQANDVKRFLDYTGKIACDKLPVVSTYVDLADVENGISGFTNSSSYLGQNWLYVKINNSVNKDEVKEWLTQNPITVQYQLANESVKTVGLAVVNQDGDSLSNLIPIEGTMHLSTSSKTINPLFSGEIPVEAITQNLSSFIND